MLLHRGAVGVLPTDTLYGLVGSALNKDAVERIYKLKKRDASKPSIILIGDVKQLDLFGISEGDKQRASEYWPGSISVILGCNEPSFTYLHRGSNALAFRLPNQQSLWKFLEESGPLIAPSANVQSQPPSTNINEAKGYFGNSVDFYMDAGSLDGKPSKLISLLGKKPRTLRS